MRVRALHEVDRAARQVELLHALLGRRLLTVDPRDGGQIHRRIAPVFLRELNLFECGIVEIHREQRANRVARGREIIFLGAGHRLAANEHQVAGRRPRAQLRERLHGEPSVIRVEIIGGCELQPRHRRVAVAHRLARPSRPVQIGGPVV